MKLIFFSVFCSFSSVRYTSLVPRARTNKSVQTRHNNFHRKCRDRFVDGFFRILFCSRLPIAKEIVCQRKNWSTATQRNKKKHQIELDHNERQRGETKALGRIQAFQRERNGASNKSNVCDWKRRSHSGKCSPTRT